MSTTLALALQLTAINGVSGVMRKVRDDVIKLGDAGKDVKRQFDLAEKSITRGLKAIAGASFIKSHMQPGIKAAADLQEAMLSVEGNIGKATMKAADLAAQLKAVRDTAVDVSKAAPFSAKEVVEIQNALLKAGVDPAAVTGKRGAAWAASGLATLSGSDPANVGDMLARIGSQYNFKSNDYGGAADTLMRAEAASPGKLEEIMYSLKQFGATAKLLNVSFKDSATMAAAMAPLGLESGTAINRFILDSSGLTKHQRESMLKLGLAKMHDGKFENLLYQGGKYIGLDSQISMMRKQFAGVGSDQTKVKLAHDIWGQEGMRAALMAGTGDDLFGNMKKEMEEALGIEERMEIRMRGFNMASKAAGGTVQSTLATAFDPLLDKLTKGVNLINDLAASIGKLMADHPGATSAVAGTAAAGLAALTGYGMFSMAKGGLQGVGVLRGMLGMDGGKAAKALQAAGGQHVFVTNWPAGMLGPGESLKQKLANRGMDAAGGAAAAGAVAKGMGLRAIAMNAGAAVAPLGVMYGVSEWAGDTSHDQERVGGLQGAGGALSRFLSAFGFNKDRDIEERRRKNREELDGSKQTINIQIDGRTVASVVNDYNARQATRN
jgi:TP901 family phage tail tape measure protein